MFCCSIFCMSNLLSHGGPLPKRYYIRCFVRAWREPGQFSRQLPQFTPVSCLIPSGLLLLSPFVTPTSAVKSSQCIVERWQLVGPSCMLCFFFPISSLNLLCRLDLSRLGAKRTAAASSVTKFCGLFLHHSCRPPCLCPSPSPLLHQPWLRWSSEPLDHPSGGLLHPSCLRTT